MKDMYMMITFYLCHFSCIMLWPWKGYEERWGFIFQSVIIRWKLMTHGHGKPDLSTCTVCAILREIIESNQIGLSRMISFLSHLKIDDKVHLFTLFQKKKRNFPWCVSFETECMASFYHSETLHCKYPLTGYRLAVGQPQI